jgi:DNA helicase II / ATP-dependent DNA helicase PcrA
MTETELLNWLKLQHSTLDEIITKAGFEFYKQNKSRPNFPFDLSECQIESYNLIRNKDLCYDRPNTAFCYSLWYHGRRVNTFLSHFAKTILNTTDTEIEIFDLGAGTGAVQWAVGLVYHKMKTEGIKVPNIKIINIDSSPFMLYYSRDYLWKYFKAVYTHCNDFDNQIEYEINTWSNSQKIDVINPWITASYLFDISDTKINGQINTEYKESVKSGFRDLIKSFNPSMILLLTSDQPPKRMLLNELKTEFSKNGYNQQEVSNTNLLLYGELVKTSIFRKQLFNKYQKHLTSFEAKSLNNTATWKDFSFLGTILTKKQVALNLAFSSVSSKNKEIKLYNERISIRREIKLNEDQKRAAIHTERPTIITGPAGCGKSVVITERLKNLIEEKQYDKSLDILVTTFNKQLMTYLGSWIENLLKKELVTRIGNTFRFKDSDKPNITLLHFDILPTRIGIKLNLLSIGFKEYHSDLIQQCISEVKLEKKISVNKYDNVLNPDYVLDEYQRVIYGLQLGKKDEYLSAERKGRPRLQVNGERRELLWNVIVEKYLTRIQKDSFITKRHKFLKQLKSGQITKKYTHIFVDEFQDCTHADYEIFYCLLTNPNNLVIAGDIAQAIQLGAVADVPRAEDEEMQRRVIHRLKGSYRLPFRISECITKITETIQDGNVITPYKGSPPGARPIVVYAETPNDFKSKLACIYKSFSVYGLDKITILERDIEIYEAMKSIKIPCETDTILKLKGLEKTCVLWSTRKDIEYKDEVAEFVYTILSRTSGILIIALTAMTLNKYNKVINLLRKDRLIIWDKETADKFLTFCIEEVTTIDEDID